MRQKGGSYGQGRASAVGPPTGLWMQGSQEPTVKCPQAPGSWQAEHASMFSTDNGAHVSHVVNQLRTHRECAGDGVDAEAVPWLLC